MFGAGKKECNPPVLETTWFAAMDLSCSLSLHDLHSGRHLPSEVALRRIGPVAASGAEIFFHPLTPVGGHAGLMNSFK